MYVLALIPARSGSKGVPDKNIREIDGHPMIAYSIKAALAAPHIDRVIVSTDSSKYADIAKHYGADVPFHRPEAISGDDSTDLEVFEHALFWLREHEHEVPDYILHLRPTTPMRDPMVLTEAVLFFQLRKNYFSSMRSVEPMSESAYKCFEIYNGQLVRVGGNSREVDVANAGRDAFPPTYKANGYVDIVRSEVILRQRKMHGSTPLAFITGHVIEVDSEIELNQLRDAPRPDYVLRYMEKP